MTDPRPPELGTIAGFDLTVADAAGILDFYASVIGWRPEPVDMGDYADFAMVAPDPGEWIAGVCHARGENADLPPQWLVYIAVDDLDASMRRCTEGGGTLLTGVKGTEGEARYCVIQDPAGAVLALLQQRRIEQAPCLPGTQPPFPSGSLPT